MKPPRRRWGRTVALIAGAAVLGLVAGTCTGYLVQTGRAPEKLPPLNQTALGRAKGPGPEPLSAQRDHQVLADGDLRELLLRKPLGAKRVIWAPSEPDWIDLADYADNYNDPAYKFKELVSDEFRRAAVVGWDTGTYQVTVLLVQFHQVDSVAAADSVRNLQEYADQASDTDSWRIPGTGNGWAYVHNRPRRDPGYEPLYSAEAHAWRGDIAVEVWVAGQRAVTKKTVMELAERQMERL